MNIPILKKEKTETLTITSPTYILGKVFNRVTKPLSASSHQLPRLVSALPYCLPSLAFPSLPSNLSTYTSLALESSKPSLLWWPTLICKWLQIRRRPEIREFQLELRSWGGKAQVIAQVRYWIQDPGVPACRMCTSILHFFIEFWFIIIAGYLFIYLFIYCSSLVCLSRWESSRKTELCMSHNPEKALLRIQLTLFCSVAQVISISVAVLSMLSVSYCHEW